MVEKILLGMEEKIRIAEKLQLYFQFQPLTVQVQTIAKHRRRKKGKPAPAIRPGTENQLPISKLLLSFSLLDNFSKLF
ncbi:MAG: hypothetical protein HFE64_08435 [Lachnospiraceae bacterium]|jgi:hypothetical protein|nr:hypothetical protein [Lachnospiraceae bacterium]